MHTQHKNKTEDKCLRIHGKRTTGTKYITDLSLLTKQRIKYYYFCIKKFKFHKVIPQHFDVTKVFPQHFGTMIRSLKILRNKMIKITMIELITP